MERCDVPRRTILSWDNIKDPADKRKILIRFDKLKDKYQDAVIKIYGDPYLYCHNQLIKQYLRIDAKAIDFFTAYRKDSIALSQEKIKEYTTCANWLNLIIELDNNWSNVKKFLSMDKKPELYDAIAKIFEADLVKLPKVYVPLKRKIAEYKEHGYDCLPTKKLGNTNSKKVKDELNHALLLEMLAHGAQYDDTFICKKYNNAARIAGFKELTAPTVGSYRHDNKAIIDAYRKGNKNWYDTAGKVIHQDRPSAPLLLINSDDNDLDLYFQDVREVQRNIKIKGTELTEKRNIKEVNYYKRPVLYVVIDGYNDYPLGYAVGDGQTNNLVYEAYLNAANHVLQLTGDHYLWHQIKTDHWNLATLKNFYESQGTFTPAKAKNARGKIIEQSFGQNWHSKLKELYPKNYKGHNIDAKFKLNSDWIDANKKFFPPIDQAPADIAAFIEELRQLPDTNGKTRQQQWLEAFDAMRPEKKRLISTEQHIMLFGVEHKHPKTGALLPNTITNNGLLVTFNGRKVFYEVPDSMYMDTLGLTVNVKYDPYDMSKVLAISKDQKTRFVCHLYQNMPMAIADYTPGTRTELNRRLEEKKSHVNFYVNAKEERQLVLKRHQLDAESLLQAGVLTKELKYAAERQLIDGGYELADDNDEIDINSMM